MLLSHQIFQNERIYPYLGAGVIPASGVSVTVNPIDEPTPGLNVAYQLSGVVSVQGGYSFGDGGDGYIEYGVGLPPSDAFTIFYVWEIPFP